MNKRKGGGTMVHRPKQARSSNKKVCDLGRSCPYQEEFQHMMEFSHDCEPAQPEDRNVSNSSSGRIPSFYGAGNKLGGESRWSPDRIRREWAGQTTTSIEDLIRCEICKTALTLENLEAHMLTHENKEKVLINEQDSAYEQSIIDDIQKQSAEDAQRQAQERMRLEEEEKIQYQEAMRISKIAAAKAAREKAIENLLSEPGSEYGDVKVAIRFTLPSGKKVPRLFRAMHCVQDAFSFLLTLEELEGKSYVLRTAVNSIALDSRDQRSFAELGITTNTSLLVVECENENDSDNYCGDCEKGENDKNHRDQDIENHISRNNRDEVNHGNSKSSSSGSSSGKANSAAANTTRFVNMISSSDSSSSSSSSCPDEAESSQSGNKRPRLSGGSVSSAITLITPTCDRKKQKPAHDSVIDLTLS